MSDEVVQTPEPEDKSKKIVDVYLDIVKQTGRVPTRADFLERDISRSLVDSVFGNLTKLHRLIETEHNDALAEYITTESSVFSTRNLSELDDATAKYKRFVITTAVHGKKVDENFLASIRNYCSLHDAKLLVIPCADAASTRKTIPWGFDRGFKGETFITREVKLNDNLFISNIQVSAKQIQPTTGLARIGQKNGSYIFASPKQFLEYVATGAGRMPRAIMTTGAITVNDYQSDFYMSQRTSYIAESDHVMGALIVELQDDRIFHFRQVQANGKGEFVDLAHRYFPDGKVVKEQADFYAGDWHSGQTDPSAARTSLKMCQDLGVNDFYVGDFFDGYSISHHHEGLPLKKAIKSAQGRSLLDVELDNGVGDMELILRHIKGNLMLVKGNHDEVLDRYLKEGRFINDPENYRLGLTLSLAVLDGKDPLEVAYKGLKSVYDADWSRIVFLQRTDESRVGGVELSQHGDKGPNGGPATMKSIEASVGKCVVGHSHTAAILRDVFRVGTFTHLDLDYMSGPSSWTHTGCLVYPDGSRQLINFIGGAWTTLKR